MNASNNNYQYQNYPSQGFQQQGYPPQNCQQQGLYQQGYQQYQPPINQGLYQQEYQEVFQQQSYKQQVPYQQNQYYKQVYQQPPQGQRYQQPPQDQRYQQQPIHQMPPQQYQQPHGSVAWQVQKISTSKRPVCFLDISIGGQMAGRIVLELFSDITPKTCENFRAICTGEKGGNMSYKGCPFHRIIPQFMVQGGDFTNHDGTGGTSIYGGEFDDENFKVKFNGKYELAMANAGPNTNGSQFFITTTNCDWLSGKHVVFGKVIQGQNVVDAMDAVGTEEGKPKTSVVIVNCGQLQ